MARKKLMAANWKMFKNPTQTQAFFDAFLPMVAGHDRDEIVICPPFIDLFIALAATKGSNVAIGAQNLHWEKEGAYTGEICPGMLLDIGCTDVIIGHSERRQYFGETDDIVAQKSRAALAVGLTPIICLGEIFTERETGKTEEVLSQQFIGGPGALTHTEFSRILLAYEPVWAIGTG